MVKLTYGFEYNYDNHDGINLHISDLPTENECMYHFSVKLNDEKYQNFIIIKDMYDYTSKIKIFKTNDINNFKYNRNFKINNTPLDIQKLVFAISINKESKEIIDYRLLKDAHF